MMHPVASAGAWTKKAWRSMEPGRTDSPQSVSAFIQCCIHLTPWTHWLNSLGDSLKDQDFYFYF